jgi:biotin carboxyl carrier protein
MEELMRHVFTLDEQDYSLWLSRRNGSFHLHAHGPAVPVSLETRADGTQLLVVAGQPDEALIVVHGETVHVHLDGQTRMLRLRDPIDLYAGHSGVSEDDVAAAPMPGTVVSVHVSEGAQVSRGETLLVIESMKLETSIRAPRDGIVASVHVVPGQVFDRSAALVSFIPEKTE